MGCVSRKRLDLNPLKQPSPKPVVWYPGRCDCCRKMVTVGQYWASGLPGRFTEVCGNCLALGDEEIVRIVTSRPWPNGAVV
jgi:hypothetical protein